MARVSTIKTALRTAIEAITTTTHAQGVTGLSLAYSKTGDIREHGLHVPHLVYVVDAGETVPIERGSWGTRGQTPIAVGALYRLRAPRLNGDKVVDLDLARDLAEDIANACILDDTAGDYSVDLDSIDVEGPSDGSALITVSLTATHNLGA